jgi:hypothetical protein
MRVVVVILRYPGLSPDGFMSTIVIVATRLQALICHQHSVPEDRQIQDASSRCCRWYGRPRAAGQRFVAREQNEAAGPR